jgi:hypothetical protein
MLRPVIFGLFTLVPQLHACSCGMMMSACDRGWNLGETIFVGKVVAMGGASLRSTDAHFIPEESFRGAAVAGIEIVIHSDGSNCNYPFLAGASYVVYATKDPRDGLLYTSRCSETKPAVMAAGDLRELRALRDRTHTDDVFGTIGIAAGGGNLEAWIGVRPLPGVPVRATDSKGISFSTQTDDRGVYAFDSLPAGTYQIEPDLPNGFAHPPPLTAEVSGGVGCRIDHFAATDGQIEGTVVDATGNPIAGFITIQPADATHPLGGSPGYDIGPDGKFALPNLPPGRYRLVYHPKTGRGVDFRATFYWPANPGDAIDLAFGQHIVTQFKVP